MKKYLQILLGLVLGSVMLLASSPKAENSRIEDRDFDGVIDRDDRCPNTPFFALVNRNGCMIKKIKISKEREEIARKTLSQRN